MTYHGFEYNKYGVCANPEIPYRFGKWNLNITSRSRFRKLRTDGSMATTGRIRPEEAVVSCCLRCNTTFLSRSKAIVAAAEFIKKCYKDDPKASRAIIELDRIIKVESEHRHTVRQMTIFDYL